MAALSWESALEREDSSLSGGGVKGGEENSWTSSLVAQFTYSIHIKSTVLYAASLHNVEHTYVRKESVIT